MIDKMTASPNKTPITRETIGEKSVNIADMFDVTSPINPEGNVIICNNYIPKRNPRKCGDFFSSSAWERAQSISL
jgi:hypothetical protein